MWMWRMCRWAGEVLVLVQVQAALVGDWQGVQRPAQVQELAHEQEQEQERRREVGPVHP